MIQHDFAYLAKHEKFLNPGQIGFGFNKSVFGTLLGSCVAITLWHPKIKCGAICHYVLPSKNDRNDHDGRYGDSAFAVMTQQLQTHGVRVTECVAKIFGGGKMFSSDSNSMDIGERNIKKARELLQLAKLHATAENVGGEGYRRLYFDVATGDVWVKFDWVDTESEDLRL